ncbi:MAG: hypothetical protein ACTSYS_11255 [Promethearchaeota archaeon]
MPSKHLINIQEKRKKIHLYSIFLTTLFIFLTILSNIKQPFNNTIVGNNIDTPEKISPEQNMNTSLIDVNSYGNYSENETKSFNVLENATSEINSRDFHAIEGNTFNISSPANWNSSALNFNLETFSKEQKITDPTFDLPLDDSNGWSDTSRESGTGDINMDFVPNENNPDFSKINLREDTPFIQNPRFYSGDYGLWEQNRKILNSQSLNISRGKIFQEKDENNTTYGPFASDPNFNKDFNNPYGGDYGTDDSVLLNWESTTSTLDVDITPGVLISGGNPSASWWSLIDIPYDVDYAEMTVTWSVEPESTFEAIDLYRVIARINNRYVDGTKWISKTDNLPYNGSAQALIVYNNPLFLEHGMISRTYNITDLIDGLVGPNKFDFGAWARNPSHGGDDDRILVKFQSIQIKFNTSNKFEVASLEFDYKCINKLNTGITPVDITDPNLVINNLSLALYLKDSLDNVKIIRVLPFNEMIIYTRDDTQVWNHVVFSLSQKYQEFLKDDEIQFRIGVIFERAYYIPIDMDIDLDNVYFRINYKHPSVSFSGLQMKEDSGTWNNIASNNISINVSTWSTGDQHSFEFRSFLLEFSINLYINILSIHEIINFTNTNDQSKANYSTSSANQDYGNWKIFYNNSKTLNSLVVENSSNSFNLSSYTITFINLPALDLNGTNSSNWNVTGARSPSSINYSGNIIKRSENPAFQNVSIISPLESGTWTLLATQPNYITNVSLNNTEEYLARPAFFFGDTINFSFTLLENVLGNYSISILNYSGDLVNTFPRYNASTGQNVSGTIKIDNNFIPGRYYLWIIWNDSAEIIPGSVIRFGSCFHPFFILNSTTAAFINTTSIVSPGEMANFSFYYRTFTGWGIPNATIQVYENSSGVPRLWGRAWSGTYLVDDPIYLGDGNYTVNLNTTGAKNGTYSLTFLVFKTFNEPQNLSTSLIINATFFLHVDIIDGASWNVTAGKYIIEEDNEPYVNDTINSVISLNITENSTGPELPVTGALIIGTIGKMDTYFEAIEVFSITHLDSDKGIYNLTLNTTGLNATLPGENETFTITGSKQGFAPINLNITIFIKKIPTILNLNPVEPVYEGETISIITSMYTEIDPSNPKTFDHGNVNYFIKNGTNIVKNGSISILANGIYQGSVSLSGIPGGNYTLITNATATNCEDAQSNNVNLTIIPRMITKINITIPDTIRILREFRIKALLTYNSNHTPIIGAIINFNITLGTSDSFIISTITDTNGESTYDYIISNEYKDQNITITAIFSGQTTLAPSSNSTTKTILGKIPVIVSIIESPVEVRTGYSATYKARINITDPGENPQNRLIFFTAYYDGNIEDLITTQQLYTDANGECEYTISEIADEKNNITIYFEFLGTTTVAYNYTSITESIQPRWTSNFTIMDLPTTIRHGQDISLILNFSCENSTISFNGLLVDFIFKYGLTVETYTAFINENMSLIFDYTIPDAFTGTLNISITFPGTNKIQSYSCLLIKNISEKITPIITFLEPIKDQYHVGTLYFIVKVTDSNGDPIENLYLIFNIGDQNISAKTNENGIATASIDINSVGKLQLKVIFLEKSIYKGSELTSENFKMVDDFMLFLEYLPYLLIAAIIAIGSAVAIRRGYVIPKRNRQREQLKMMYQRLSDVENIQYILILDKKSGVPIFSKSLAEVPIDESLVSGFLSAISSFGKEIGQKMKGIEGGGLEELSYRQFKIILNEGQHVRTALLLLKRPSESLKKKLKTFNQIFEKRFKREVSNFMGAVLEDIRVTPVIEEVFEADLLYPHHLIENKVPSYIKTIQGKDLARKVIAYATSEDFEHDFYIRDMINYMKTKGHEEIKTFEAIERLKNDKVVFALNPRTNLLIAELKPIIDKLDKGDKNILFATFNHANDGMSITKYLNKNRLSMTRELHEHLEVLMKNGLINKENRITATGAAIVTLLQLIPEL